LSLNINPRPISPGSVAVRFGKYERLKDILRAVDIQKSEVDQQWADCRDKFQKFLESNSTLYSDYALSSVWHAHISEWKLRVLQLKERRIRLRSKYRELQEIEREVDEAMISRKRYSDEILERIKSHRMAGLPNLIPDEVYQKLCDMKLDEEARIDTLLNRLDRIEHIYRNKQPVESCETPPLWKPSDASYTIPDCIARKIFPDARQPLALFRRPATDSLYEFLERQRCCLVTGPPGTGKSTNAFAYACGIVRNPSRRVVWYQMQTNRILVMNVSSVELYPLDTDLVSLLKQERITDVFLDQFDASCRTSYMKLVYPWAEEFSDSSQQRRLIVITSDGFNGKLLPFTHKNTTQLEPWSFQDYQESLRRPQIRGSFMEFHKIDQDILDEFVLQKFYYAGISARFFFECAVGDIIAVVEKALRRVPSWEAVNRGDIGTESHEAVNTLYYSVSNNGIQYVRFSSGFVTKMFGVRNRPESFISSLGKFGISPNRGNVGHHFEGYVISLISNNVTDLLPLELHEKVTDTGIVSWVPIGHLMFGSDTLCMNTWYIPDRTQQPGFDLFRILKVSQNIVSFSFVQVTVGQSHSWNPVHFATAVEEMQSRLPRKFGCRVDIHFLIPEKNGKFFEICKTGNVSRLHAIDSRWTESNFRALIKVHLIPRTDIFAASEPRKRRR
jgi:hypothetical protein